MNVVSKYINGTLHYFNAFYGWPSWFAGVSLPASAFSAFLRQPSAFASEDRGWPVHEDVASTFWTNGAADWVQLSVRQPSEFTQACRTWHSSSWCHGTSILTLLGKFSGAHAPGLGTYHLVVGHLKCKKMNCSTCAC